MTTETSEPSRTRRRLVWICAGLGLLLLMALVPPLFNVNRLKHRIAASMSATLARPVHLDRVRLHLLPVPGFTLENLVVGEEPAFGAEPVIRANTVEVRLRPGSLWRRQVEFSSIKFVEPSLNLVRNVEGEWNVQSLLMHAAKVDTAPTEQSKAGPEPRFPYVEATGARVNVKLGEEKKPFSLTEADFALWLPTSQQWHVRLMGKPVRTDTNISDPGTLRLEGSLERAPTMAEVPVDLTASWDGAPMGEASKLLRGEDAGWRGNLNVTARLMGKLGEAKLTTKFHVNELRRADFLPVQTMELRAECGGTLDVGTAIVRNPDCSLNTPLLAGAKTAGRVVAIADGLDLSTMTTSGLHVGMTAIPNAWILNWARLFSQRIPAGAHPGGTLAGSVLFGPAQKAERGGNQGGKLTRWQGEIHGDIVGVIPWKPLESTFIEHPIALNGSEAGWVLAPLSLTPPGTVPELTLSGSATLAGYSLHLVGSATRGQILALRTALPPLGDGLQQGLPELATTAAGRQIKIDLTCTRLWGAAQTCVGSLPSPPKRGRRRR